MQNKSQETPPLPPADSWQHETAVGEGVVDMQKLSPINTELPS
jgi:hypothetical protein